jgi:16S rRNA (adenine1518-N6/adenine1519-N6)-dimethyltransferase
MGRKPYPPTLKRLGQHFLTDDRVVQRIADALDIGAHDTVVEIGPGRGVLTDLLAARAGRVVAVELDRALAGILRERYADRPSVEIVERDILSVEIASLGGDGYLLAGNVPYYITTPILFHALKPPLPARAVFLVQREVAERAMAPEGSRTYGALSVNLQAVASVEIVCNVPAGAFRPPPKVESAVMLVRPLDVPLVSTEERVAFQNFVQSVFGLRRKQMVRVIRTILSLDPEQAAQLLHAADVDPETRPETLAPADFARLFRAVRERER